MNILSLFDGMSCGQIALNRANINIDAYYASEIKKSAIIVTKNNFPKTIHVGNIKDLTFENLPKIDMLIGGSPCQDFSRLKTGKERSGLNGDKSSLFYEYLRLLRLLNPKYFLLENVRMKDEHKKEIDKLLNVTGIFINSNLVSYQNRDRCYWTNIPNIKQPRDKNISFQDYKETDYILQKKRKVNNTPSRVKMWEKQCPNVTYRKKINCLTRKQDRRNNSGLIEFEDFCRYLTRREMEQAQTVPVGYTNALSIRQAEDILGDGWTVDVISHIFSFLPEEYKINNNKINNN